jgi:hypothetical protein
MKTLLVLFFVFIQSVSFAQVPNWKGTIETKDSVQYFHNPKEGLWEKDKTKKLKADRVFALGSLNANEDYLFSWVQQITTDLEGNIFACDSKEHRIQVYNEKGKYLRSIGGKGKGPGELLRPMKTKIGKNGNIYVDDNLNYRISIFNQNGEFKNSFRIDGFSSDIELNQNGNVLMNHIFRGGKILPIVIEYDEKGNIIKEYGDRLLILKKDNYGQPKYANNGFIMRNDGVLLVHFSYPYMIKFFENGILKKVIDRDSPLFTEPEIIEIIYTPPNGPADKIKTVKQRSYIWQTFLLPGGRFATFIRDAGIDYKKSKSDREFDTFIDLFDSEGRFLKTYKWDWQKNGLIKHVDSRGYFYTNFGETEIVPGVTKWKVTFE